MVAYCLKIAIYMCLLLVMKLLGREKEPWVEEKEREEEQKVPTSTPFQERNLKHERNLKNVEAYSRRGVAAQ